jgi:hypothetical protein
VEDLINNMGAMHIEQEAMLQLAQQNAQLLQAIQAEEAQCWDGWSNIILHHSEQKPSLREILSPTKVSILS